ncbi:MAG: primosomal protein N', partial [Planctomycetota bacterium]
ATLAATLARLAPAGGRVLGPAPCPIARISNRFRQQVELHAASPTILQQLLADARAAGHLRLGRTMAVDVDPLALL